MCMSEVQSLLGGGKKLKTAGILAATAGSFLRFRCCRLLQPSVCVCAGCRLVAGQYMQSHEFVPFTNSSVAGGNNRSAAVVHNL